jgi:hypothetical protein
LCQVQAWFDANPGERRPMPQICGELKQLAIPTGGGHVVTHTVYSDGTASSSSFKNRMVFPLIRIGDTTLEGVIAANDRLGQDIVANLRIGENVCLITFGHLLRKKIVIGACNGQADWFRMPLRGYLTGMLLYLVFMPVIIAIPAAIVGMLVGMVFGREGSALGLFFGLVFAVGISWLTAWRLHAAHSLMTTAIRESVHGKDLRRAGAGR